MNRHTFALISLLSTTLPAVAQRPDPGRLLSPAEAHAKAVAGEIVLVDVRTADEWKETGLPASAHAITMHQDGRTLVAELDRVLGGDRNKPLAIICRTGNRTSHLQAALKAAGYGNVFNVAEGMAGGPYGRGWLKAGLPTRPGSGPQSPVPAARP
jgi:rhodanese-related sulfurtransferase